MRLMPNHTNAPSPSDLVSRRGRATLWATILLTCAATLNASDPPPTTQPAEPPVLDQPAGAVDQASDPDSAGPKDSATGSTTQPVEARKGPVWACSEQTIQTEPVWAGQDVSCTFTIRNEGTTNLKIKAKGGWGVGICGRSDRTIKPGQSDELTIKLGARRRPGPVNKTIRVTTNDPKHRNVTLVCKGTVKAAYKISPSSLDFGQLKRRDGPQRKEVMIRSADAGPLNLELLPIENPGLEAALHQIKPGEEYKLEVTIKPQLVAGSVQEKVKLKSGFARVRQLAIPIHASIAPRVQARPRKITIPSESASEVVKHISLIWDDDSPAKILEATVDDPALTVRVEEQAGREVVVVEIPPKYERQGKAAVVTIKTDDTDAPKVRVPVRIARARSAAKEGSRGARAATRRGKTGSSAPAKPGSGREAPSASKRTGKKKPNTKSSSGDGH